MQLKLRYISQRKSFNPILRGAFGQRKMPLYLTPKPKVMGTPSLKCELVSPNFFRKIGFKLMTSSL